MNVFMEYWRAGGPLMPLLFGVCVLVWYAMLAVLPALRRAVGGARMLQNRLHRDDGPVFDVVGDWLASRPADDPVSRATRYVLAGDRDRRTVRERLAEAVDAELARLRRHQRMLRALVAAAPLMGLLGTVQGMVETFTALSGRGVVSMETLSSGISQALLTTQAGLVVALPGLVGAHAIERRLKELGDAFEQLELRFLAACRSDAPPPGCEGEPA